MNILASLLAAFCASAVFIGALYMICPEGAMKNSVKYILGLVFLISVIAASGITVKKSDLDFDMIEAPAVSAKDLDIASAKYVYSFALKENDIDFSEITVCTDKYEDGSIYISKVIIKSDENREKILSALAEAAKNIEVVIENE